MIATKDPDDATALPPLHTITMADLERHADATGLRCLPGCTIQAHGLCSACRPAGARDRDGSAHPAPGQARAQSVGGQAALDAATAQSHCSGDYPSDYLLDGLSVAIDRERERARNDERVELLGLLGADTLGMAFATRDDVLEHVRQLESRAARELATARALAESYRDIAVDGGEMACECILPWEPEALVEQLDPVLHDGMMHADSETIRRLKAGQP